MSVLLLTTVSGDVTLNDLKGYIYIHPTVDSDVYDIFTIEDIENSLDFKTALDGGFITLKDVNGNSVLDITSISTLQSYIYDKNNNGKIDADASNIESVNGQTGLVNINEPTFTGTTAIPGAGDGSIPDDGTLATGTRALFDDGLWKIVAPGGGGDLISTNNLSDLSNTTTAFDNIKQVATATLTGVVEIATQIEVDAGLDTSMVITPETLYGSSLAAEVAANTSKTSNAAHTGEVSGDTTLTITNNAVTNIKLADMPALTVKGRLTPGSGDPENLSTNQIKLMLDLTGTNSGDEPTFSGTTAVGLSKGLIPDDSVDSTGTRVLKDNGIWENQKAVDTTYDPLTPANWNTLPTDVKEALDILSDSQTIGNVWETIWAEESTTLSNNNRQWSFGNGATGAINTVVMYDAEITKMFLHAEVQGTSVTVDVMVNNAIAVTGTFDTVTNVFTFVAPISVVEGDFIGFQTNTVIGTWSDVRTGIALQRELTGIKGEKGDPGTDGVDGISTNGGAQELEYAKRTSISTQNVTSTPTAIPWQTELKDGGMYITWSAVNNTRLTAKENGTYNVGGFFAVQEPSDARVQHTIEVRINGVSSGIYRSSGYIRNSGSSWDYCIYELSTTPIDLNTDDYIEIFIQQHAGVNYAPSGSISSILIGNKSQIWLERYKGAKGSKGDTGAGSNIIIQKDDFTVGTVTDELNFEGTGVTSVIDEGLNKTTVTITDTIYDDTTIQGEVDLNTAKVGITPTQASDITSNNAKVTNVDHPLVETAVPVGAVFTDTTYTDSDIKTKYENNINTNVYTDIEKNKLGSLSIAGQYIERITTAVTTSTNTEYLTFTTSTISAGNYEITVSYTWGMTSISNNARFRCQVDNTHNIFNPGGDGWHEIEGKDTGSDIKVPHTGHRVIALTSGTHQIDFDFGRGDNNGDVRCYSAHITIRQL